MNNFTTNILNNFFEKSLRLFSKLKNHESIDEFCENEAFGFLFSTAYDSKKNRQFYKNLLKSYIITNKDQRFSNFY